CWRPTKYSWKPISPSPATSTIVRTGWSVIGSSRTSRPHAPVISAVTTDRGAPSARRCVRERWVARSRSPSENHVPPADRPPPRLHGGPRLAGQAPAPLRVDGASQRVRDGVEVGRDGQAV